MNMKSLVCGAALMGLATSASAVTDRFEITSGVDNGSGTVIFTNPFTGVGQEPYSIMGTFDGQAITGLDTSHGESNLLYTDYVINGIDTMSHVDLSGFGVTTSVGYYDIVLVQPGLDEIVGTTIPTAQAATFNISSVPEPTTWALMLIGVGFAGATIRSRRRSQIAGIPATA